MKNFISAKYYLLIQKILKIRYFDDKNNTVSAWIYEQILFMSAAETN